VIVPIRIDPPTGHVADPPADIATALRWFDTEHACLLAAQQLAVREGWHPVVWQLALALDAFHIRRGHHHDAVLSWQAGLAAADEPAAQRLARVHLGRACAWSGRYAEALDLLRQALTLAEHAGDLASQASVHGALTLLWEFHGDQRLALSHAIRALRLRHALGDAVQETTELAVVGWHLACLGHHDKARDICDRAIAQARRQHNDNIEAAALDTLGYIAYDTGQHTAALDYYGRALPIFHAIGWIRVEADIHAQLGDIHAALGQREDARVAWQRALDLYQKQHRTADADRVRLNLIRR
jgi:tetratricopeptide (TPR) repeat protein